MTRCGGGGTVLMSYNTIPADTVPRSARCQKSLCQRKFYAADEAAKANAGVPAVSPAADPNGGSNA